MGSPRGSLLSAPSGVFKNERNGHPIALVIFSQKSLCAWSSLSMGRQGERGDMAEYYRRSTSARLMPQEPRAIIRAAIGCCLAVAAFYGGVWLLALIVKAVGA